MLNDLSNKVALVTGGAVGIGRATALAFARQNAKVVVADVDNEAGQFTVQQIKEAGGDAAFIPCDVSKSAEVEAMMAQLLSLYGRLDCACNNAAIEGDLASTVECTEENWDRTIAVNLKGVWLCLRAEIRQMLQQEQTPGGYGIVNISSVAGMVAERGFPAYSAAKGGVISLTRTAAIEYSKLGVRVNAICPGVIATPMIERTGQKMDLTAMFPEMRKSAVSRTIAGLLSRQSWFTDRMVEFIEPIGRRGQPEEIAETVVWLCSPAASFITGHALVADGGMTAA